MSRIDMCEQKIQQLFGDAKYLTEATDPDFCDIVKRFVFGEVFSHGSLTDKQRELVTLVALTVNQSLDQFRVHVGVALNVGVTPVEIKEAIYQCTPYVGFPKILNVISQANEVFKERNIPLPVESQRQVDEDIRLDKGLTTRKAIFGDVIDQKIKDAPADQKHIQHYLNAFCFGDFYTRSGLDLKDRELLTLCVLSALGGSEGQLKVHIKGNLRVGNDRETMIAAITQCTPYMGFPRTLNALTCINELVP
jgi:4-carboxymuconolactone decarboxylase